MDIDILVLNDNIDKSSEEAFEMLRGDIQFYSKSHQMKTLTIVSPTPNVGKTTISLYLAVSMAKINIKVLLVDADFRKPMIFKKLGISNKSDLSDYFQHKVQYRDTIIKTNIPNLSYAYCWQIPAKPSEIISSKNFSELIKLFREDFDIVIFDTPFLGNVIDAAIIASQTDATILVLELGNTTMKSLELAIDQLKQANANIIGTVFNKVSKSNYREHYENHDYFNKIMENPIVL